MADSMLNLNLNALCLAVAKRQRTDIENPAAGNSEKDGASSTMASGSSSSRSSAMAEDNSQVKRRRWTHGVQTSNVGMQTSHDNCEDPDNCGREAEGMDNVCSNTREEHTSGVVVRARQITGDFIDVQLGHVDCCSGLAVRIAVSKAMCHPANRVVLFRGTETIADGHWLDASNEAKVLNVDFVLNSLPAQHELLQSFLTFVAADTLVAAKSMRELAKCWLVTVDNHCLEYLPDCICELKTLRVLQVYDCSLRELPDSIGELRGLRTLRLERNQLQMLPETFGNLSGLHHLTLNHNPLVLLPDTFSKLESLATLRLEYTQLRRLPETFGQLARLEDLFVNDSKLKRLPDSFGQLAVLRTLRLQNNCLSSLPLTFEDLFSTLRYANLRRNPLTSVQRNHLLQLPYRQMLYIEFDL